MDVRQSHLKAWAGCPVRFKYENVDLLPRLQSAALTFGSLMHECVQILEETQSPEAATAHFQAIWPEPEAYNPEWKIDYYLRATSFRKYKERGPKIISNWWSIYQWNSDVILAREYQFRVPIGTNGNFLTGTIDRLGLRHMPRVGAQVVLLSDLKTTRTAPTLEALSEDLQFSAYAYATTHPAFWDGIPNGAALAAQLMDAPRWGEWIHLVDVKRLDAGERTDRHYTRLAMAVDALAASIEAGIYVPNISGQTCVWCDWRTNCGLPERAE